MRGKLLVLAAASGLLFAAPADAGNLERALVTAERVHPLNCSARVLIERPVVWIDRDAEASPSECLVRFRPGFVSGSSDVDLCDVAVHEWGHLAGLQHTHGGHDNMDADVRVHHPACGRTRETAYAEASGARPGDLRKKLRRTRARRQQLRCASRPLRRRVACRRDARRLRQIEVRLARRLRRVA